MADLTGRTIAFLVAPEGIEQVELTDPWAAVEDAGGTPRLLVARRRARCRRSTTSTRATRSPSTRSSATPTPTTYDGLVLPGGVANPDALRMDEDAVAFVRDFVDSDRPVAAICHAPWTLAEAASCAAGG